MPNSITSKRFSSLVEIGCIVCRLYYQVYSPPEIHHTRFNRGIGHRKDDESTIGLCPYHHRVSHNESFHLARTWFEETFGSEESLLAKTNELLMCLK